MNMCWNLKPAKVYVRHVLLIDKKLLQLVDQIQPLLSYVARNNFTEARDRQRQVRIANLVAFVCEACVAFGKNTFHPHEEGFWDF